MSRDRRRRPVSLVVEHNGKKVKGIGCPFCRPSHILPADGTPSPECGTYLYITAIQNIYFEKDITCIVCGKGGGTLVKVGDKYKHVHDCVPGKRLFSSQPRLSKTAAMVWKLPHFAQTILKLVPVEVRDMDNKVIGYTFDKP
jgi:hypothetical protein